MMKRHRSTALISIVAALGIVLAFAEAQAASYTLSSSINMVDPNDAGNVLDINPVFDDSGAITCLSGTCTGPDYLIFEVSVVSGDFEEIVGAALVATVNGVGYLSGVGTVPSTGAVGLAGANGQFDFDAPNLDSSLDSVRLIISFDALAGTETVSISATAFNGILFNEIGGIITPIPEPGTATMLALGLVAFGLHRRTQRRLAR